MRKLRIVLLILTICWLVRLGYPGVRDWVRDTVFVQQKNWQAERALARGDTLRAIERLEAVSHRQPANVELHLRIVDLYTKYKEARTLVSWEETRWAKPVLAHLAAAAYQRPRDVPLQERVARAFVLMQDIGSAREAARRAVKFGSREADVMELAFTACIEHSEHWFAELLLEWLYTKPERYKNLRYLMLSSQLARAEFDVVRLSRILDESISQADHYTEDKWLELNRRERKEALDLLRAAATQRLSTDVFYARAPRILRVLEQFSGWINDTGLQAYAYQIAIELFDRLYEQDREQWSQATALQESRDRYLKRCEDLLFSFQEFAAADTKVDLSQPVPIEDHRAQVHLLSLMTEAHLARFNELERAKNFTFQNRLIDPHSVRRPFGDQTELDDSGESNAEPAA